ncbi:unnamed protein product [Ectocarpus fasciculatus]
MRPLHHAIREVVRAGKVDVQQVRGRRRMGGLSLASTADRRKRDGVDARRPTGAMELRRAAEVQKCADKGWKSALICLGNMRKGGVSPGSAAYNVALKACAGAGEWGRAAALVEDMQGSGAIPADGIVAEIRAAGDGVGVTALDDDGDLSCDSPDADVSSVPSGAARSKGDSGGGIQGSIASMHTVAFGADVAWPSRRPTQDEQTHTGSSTECSSMSSSSMSSSSTSGGSHGSIANLHNMALGADVAWPSRRPTNSNDGRISTGHNSNSNNVTGNCGGSDGGSAAMRGSSGRSLGSIAWGGRRWRSLHQENQDETPPTAASPATRGGSGDKAGGVPSWSSVAPAPFAGSWGDD